MHYMKPLAAFAALGLAFSLAACGSDSKAPSNGAGSSSAPAASATEPTDKTSDAAEDKDVTGINEIEVGDSGPQNNDALEVSAVYFQAVDLEHGTMAMPPASESGMHFEIDVKTTEKAKDWGYEAGQFMPYLKVNAVATNKDTGEKIDLGTMMPMIASDGPHYGNNIKLAPGKYDVEISIASPGDEFMLHTGKDSSGVKGRFWTEPLTFEFQNWNWDGQLI